MKDNTNIDELFRKGTEHHYPFDESLWAAVEGQLPSQQTKPFLWIFNLNSMALLLMLFVCAIIPTDNTRADKRSTLVESNLPKKIVVPSNNNKKNLTESSIKKKDNLIAESKTKQTTIKANTTQIATTELLNNSTAKATEKKTNKRLNQNSSTTSSSSNSKNKNNSSATSNLDENQQIFGRLTNKNAGFERSKSLFNKSTKKEVRLIQNLNFINSLDFEDLNSSLIVGSPLTKENDRRSTPTKSFYVELEMSQDINVEKTVKSSNQDLQMLKQDNEKSLNQTLIGLNFIKQRKSFIYGIGIHHSKYTERVTYLLDKESLGYDITYDTTYQLISGNFNSNGTPVFLINQEVNETRNPTTIIVDDEIISINTFKRIGVPVFIGVQQDYKNWVAELRTSLSFNYLYQSQGIYLTNGLDQVESINSGTQLESMVIGNKNDLSVGYSFHEQFALGARYSLYNDLSSFTSGYESRIRNQSIGVWILWKPE